MHEALVNLFAWMTTIEIIKPIRLKIYHVERGLAGAAILCASISLIGRFVYHASISLTYFGIVMAWVSLWWLASFQRHIARMEVRILRQEMMQQQINSMVGQLQSLFGNLGAKPEGPCACGECSPDKEVMN